MVVIWGLLVGSFVNVLIYRIPRKISFITPRSRCESCQSLVKWYQNIPVISFIFLRGRCAYCGKNISWRHPLVEVATAVVAYLLFPKYLDGQTLVHFCFFFTLFCALMVHFFIDLDFQILPDGINLYLAILFLTYSLFFYSWGHWLGGGFWVLASPILSLGFSISCEEKLGWAGEI